jgi:hypothetical protein
MVRKARKTSVEKNAEENIAQEQTSGLLAGQGDGSPAQVDESQERSSGQIRTIASDLEQALHGRRNDEHGEVF